MPKPSFFLLVAGIGLILDGTLPAGGAEAAPVGPVGAWLFTSPAATLNDDSGHGNSAAGGAAEGWVRVATGKRWLFTGQAAGVWRVADSPSLHLGQGSFTFECWVCPHELPGPDGRERRRILSKVRPHNWLALDLQPTGQVLLDLSDDQGRQVSAVSTGKLPGQSWTHLAVSVDRGAGQVGYYLNGRLDSVCPLPAAFAGGLDLADAPLEIGGSWQPFVGFLDQLRLYKRAVTPAEIAAHFAAERADKTSGAYEKPLALAGDFSVHPEHAVYAAGEPVEFDLRLTGRREAGESLTWQVKNFRGQPVKTGDCAVPAGEADWTLALSLPSTGPGYYELTAGLAKAGIGFGGAASSAPAGVRAYAVLPAITPLPLTHPDDSRFGLQGGARLASDGDPFGPLYPLVGARWVHAYRAEPWLTAPAWVEKHGPNTYQPELDAARQRQDYRFYARHDLSAIFDLTSTPAWLMACPPGVNPPAPDQIVPAHNCQDYPPRDWAYYGDLLTRMAREKRIIREQCFSAQRHSYYKIHWEVDWYWKGSDADFIKLYATAAPAIKAADPAARLLGPNYGVIATGNRHLQRLLPQGLGKYLDGITTHSYFLAPTGENGSSPEAGGLVREARTLVRLARQYLPAGAPVINTEGSSRLGGYNPTFDHWALTRQAAWFLRTHLICLGEGFSSTWFFLLVDNSRYEGYGLFYNLDLPHNYQARQVAPKPVFSAVATATRLLEGTTSRGALEYLGEHLLGYAFDRADERLVVLWSTDERPREAVVPVGVEAVDFYDPMGACSRLETPGGLARVPVDGHPVYLLGAAAAALPEPGADQPAGLPGDALKPGAKPAATGTHQLWRDGQALTANRDGQIVIPAAAQPGIWLLQTRSNGRLVCSQTVRVLPPVDFQLSGDHKFRERDYKFTLTNQASAPLKGTLRLHSGETRRDLGEFELKPGQVRAEQLDLPRLGLASPVRRQYALEFTDQAGVVSRSPELECAFTSVPRFPSPPHIDGELADWQSVPFDSVSGESALIIRAPLAPLQGPADLSFAFVFAYDPQAIYLALRVRDQDHVQTHQPDRWRDDSVQLALATGWNGEKWRVWRKLLLSLDSRDGRVECTGNLAGRAQCAIRRNPGETDYELAVPWSVLDPELTGIPPERRLGVGILVNDRDSLAPAGAESANKTNSRAQAITEQAVAEAAGNPCRKGMEAYGGMFWQRNPGELGILLLADQEPR